MNHVLTLVADRTATTLSPALIGRVRDAIGGGVPVILSDGEAVDIPCAGAPDTEAARAALEGVPVDAISVPVAGRRKGLLLADMDSTIVTGETLDELADLAGSRTASPRSRGAP